MPSTLNPACPLCGLRFGNKPHLELHVREDHRQHALPAQSGSRVPGKTRLPASGAGGPPDPHHPPAVPACTSKEAPAAPARPGRRASPPKAALRRALRALHAHER